VFRVSRRLDDGRENFGIALQPNLDQPACLSKQCHLAVRDNTGSCLRTPSVLSRK
jgi:hypothetical protein